MTATDSQGPLTGLRILEIGHFIAAPFCTRVLGDLGADIIKVEPPGGDPVREWGAKVDGKSLWWSVHGRNKRSITVNLKAAGAAETLLRIAKGCDAMVENFRPGQLARMGLGDGAFRKIAPGLVIAHVSGYGQDGPYRDRAAFGVIGEAIGGLRHLSNHAPGATDLPPVRVGVSIGDSLAGLYAALGVMSALWRRDGPRGDADGRTVDVALTDSVLSLMEGMLPEYGALGQIRQPTGSRIPTASPSSAYPTSDGKWMMIAANSAPLFARLAQAMKRPELLDDPRFADNPSRVEHVDALDRMIGDWTRTMTATALQDLLEQADIPSTRAYDSADCATDPQFLHRGMVHSVHDPRFDRDLLHPGVVPHVPDDPGRVRTTGPGIGQHTDEILSEAGFSRDEITDLSQRGVI